MFIAGSNSLLSKLGLIGVLFSLGLKQNRPITLFMKYLSVKL